MKKEPMFEQGVTLTYTGGNIFFTLIGLVCYYSLGRAMENLWGTLRFNLFYFTGVAGSIIAGFLTGYTTSYYLNLSLMLAVAILYPMMQISLYGIILTSLCLFAFLAFLALACQILFERHNSALTLLYARFGSALQEVDKVKIYDDTCNDPARHKRKYYTHNANFSFEHIDNSDTELTAPATAEAAVSTCNSGQSK